MQQYINLLKEILEKGTKKVEARPGMPGTTSIFGHQMRFDLQEGFPLVTTRPIFWKGIVTELIWFLRGDTNIKFLLDNGVNIWNGDAYNYYCKQHNLQFIMGGPEKMTIKDFVYAVKNTDIDLLSGKYGWQGYSLGECGFQYGKVWRAWKSDELIWSEKFKDLESEEILVHGNYKSIDQIFKVIQGIKKNPGGRRHIVTAIDPAHDEDLALFWCHAIFQFNCRKLTPEERVTLYMKESYADPFDFGYDKNDTDEIFFERSEKQLDNWGYTKYHLDCHLYQRSADVMLGVPFNIASYSLLTHIVAKMCNMVPGEFIHTFGDVHIYDNHIEAAKEQIELQPRELPKLELIGEYTDLDSFLSHVEKVGIMEWWDLMNYAPHSKLNNPIELSTGM